MSIDSIITALGGTSNVATALGVSASVVSNWRSRGRIPFDRWEALAGLARERGVKEITFETFRGLRAERTSESAGARV